MAKKNSIKAIITQPAEPVKQEVSSFYNVPDSPATHLIYEVLEAGKDIAELPARKRQINHNTNYEVLEAGNKRKILSKNGAETAEIEIELDDIYKLTGSNKPAKKLLVLALIKANEQAIHSGKLTKDYISFSLKELIDIGFYKTPQSARKGFNSGADALTSLKVRGTVKKTKKQAATIDRLEVLFTGAEIIKGQGQCYLYLNTRISWSFLAQYFTILPRYYFRLPNRASDLLYYIFYLARQNTDKIERQHYFTISFRAIQHELQLPSEKRLNNPLRDIKEAIETAVGQIEKEHSNYYHNKEFSLELVYDEAATISDYLDNGYLKIKFEETFAKVFIELYEKAAKKIEQAKKKQERIQAEAITRATAKKLENKE